MYRNNGSEKITRTEERKHYRLKKWLITLGLKDTIRRDFALLSRPASP